MNDKPETEMAYAPELVNVAVECLQQEDAWAAVEQDAKDGVPEAMDMLGEVEGRYQGKREEVRKLMKEELQEDAPGPEELEELVEGLLVHAATLGPDGVERRQIFIEDLSDQVLMVENRMNTSGGLSREEQEGLEQARAMLEGLVERTLITEQEERGQELDEASLRTLLQVEVSRVLAEASGRTGIEISIKVTHEMMEHATTYLVVQDAVEDALARGEDMVFVPLIQSSEPLQKAVMFLQQQEMLLENAVRKQLVKDATEEAVETAMQYTLNSAALDEKSIAGKVHVEDLIEHMLQELLEAGVDGRRAPRDIGEDAINRDEMLNIALRRKLQLDSPGEDTGWAMRTRLPGLKEELLTEKAKELGVPYHTSRMLS